MQNMAVDADQEESLSGFRKRLETREFRYPLAYIHASKNSRSTEKHTSLCSRTLYIILHHIIIYKLLIVT